MNSRLEQLIAENEKQLVSKINHLIVGQRKGFIEQYKKEKEVLYYTSKKSLTDSVVRSHLQGTRTVGCFYLGKYSKFLCFDVDVSDENIVNSMINAIQEWGISINDIHVELSGLKGWHIWLFFNEPILINDLVEFGKFIISKLGQEGKKIELRPENDINSRGIKLPFAIHKKANVRTTFKTNSLQELKNPIQYFLDIKPISGWDIQERLILLKEETLQHRKLEKKYTESELPPLREQICPGYSLGKKLIDKGMQSVEMTESKRRHYYQFFVALYYKSQGYSEEQTKDKVIEWAINELKQGRSNSSQDEIILDVTNDIAHIYRKNKQFHHKSNSIIVVSKNDIEAVNMYDDFFMKKVIWCILLLGSMFHENGEFYFSLRQIAKMTDCSKNTVDRRLRILIEDGFVVRTCTGSYNSYNPRASNYFVPSLLKPRIDNYEMQPTANTFKELFEETYLQIESLNFQTTKEGITA
ncbi:TOTE conflict system archaeo-eukaryotic primase domain-containing protein [Calidifontibacillus oryziterrae]|uniref:TOTE conflict system archaeo-eukaryotic primase domain-containing protein n=1 Tax=Calidifontibacillus oryziterrae TaxID=1191699 RepID=UPI0003109B80|nr:hypothetical protein [Calidifontibacillus oryziterrae]